jgi:putative transposase
VAQIRRTILANGEYYHIFNRGIDKQPTFTVQREFERAVLTLDYYRFENLPLRLSKALQLNLDEKKKLFDNLSDELKKAVEVVTYCFMPNHFHFLLKQKENQGIKKFVSNFCNSYTRYFNTRRKGRNGPIFQGVFKSVHIEDDEQLLHLHRYIHINPVVSFVVKKENLENYEWSSFQEYLGKSNKEICDKEIILKQFSSIKNYRQFIFNQIDYAKKLAKIKHLLVE